MASVRPNFRARAGGNAYGTLGNGTDADPQYPLVTTAYCAGNGVCPSIRNWDIAESEIQYLRLRLPLFPLDSALLVSIGASCVCNPDAPLSRVNKCALRQLCPQTPFQ